MTELDAEVYTSNKPTTLFTCSLNASREKSYSKKNKNMINQKYSSYPSRQGRNFEIYSHCYASGYNKPNCWKKYSEKLPNTQKKIEQYKKTNFSHPISNGKKTVFFLILHYS